MSATIIPTLVARLDLERILEYFVTQKRSDVASRFNDAFEETLAFIADFPELGIPLDSAKKRLANIRIAPIRGFKRYLVYYRIHPDGVYILRVYHGHGNVEGIL